MKCIVIAVRYIVIAFAALLLAGTAMAQPKIGYLDIERIARESVPAKAAQQKLERDFAPRDQELQRAGQRVLELRNNLEKNGLTLSDADRREKQREIEGLTLELQRNQAAFQEDLKLRRTEALAAMGERTEKALNVLMQAESFDLVVKEAVYVNPRIDITERILKALAAGDAK